MKLALTIPLLIGAIASLPRGETTMYYSVYGMTVDEVRESINRTGPVGSDGKRYDAKATSSIKWKFKSKGGPTGCTADSLVVTVDIVYTMPEWSNVNSLSPSIGIQWRQYMTSLKRHEVGHKKIADGAADTLRALVVQIPEQTSCALLSQVVNDSARSILARERKNQIKYDTDTDHGRSQGARFP